MAFVMRGILICSSDLHFYGCESCQTISKATKLSLSEVECSKFVKACAKVATKTVLYAKTAKKKGNRAHSRHYELVYLVSKKEKFVSREQLLLYQGIVNLATCQHVRC